MKAKGTSVVNIIHISPHSNGTSLATLIADSINLDLFNNSKLSSSKHKTQSPRITPLLRSPSPDLPNILHDIFRISSASSQHNSSIKSISKTSQRNSPKHISSYIASKRVRKDNEKIENIRCFTNSTIQKANGININLRTVPSQEGQQKQGKIVKFAWANIRSTQPLKKTETISIKPEKPVYKARPQIYPSIFSKYLYKLSISHHRHRNSQPNFITNNNFIAQGLNCIKPSSQNYQKLPHVLSCKNLIKSVSPAITQTHFSPKPKITVEIPIRLIKSKEEHFQKIELKNDHLERVRNIKSSCGTILNMGSFSEDWSSLSPWNNDEKI